MKNRIFYLLVMAMLLGFPSAASAQYFEVGGITYNVLSPMDHTVEVSMGCNFYHGHINIPATVTYGGITYDVVALGKQAFYGASLSSITIPSTVTQIKAQCFLFASGLSSIQVSSTVTDIGPLAFAAYGLNAINVDANNPNYRTIGRMLFSKDTTTLVECPMGKSGTIALPQNTRHLAPDAFAYCQTITGVTLPEGLSSIGTAAFMYNKRLNNVVIPSAVTYIGENPFTSCSALNNLTIASGNSHYYLDGMMLYSMGGDTLKSCHKSADSLFLPSTVRVVSGFNGNTDIKYLHLPEETTTILDNAFGFSSLESVDLSNTMSLIDAYAFYYCESLTRVGMPTALNEMGEGCFEGCSSLTSITLPNGLRTVPQEAFYFCESLKNITWGDAVAVIDSFAFGGCAFVELQLPATLRSVRCGAFNGYYDGTIRRVVFSVPVDTIESEAFYGQPLTSVRLRNSLPPVATTYQGMYGPLDDSDVDTLFIPCGSLSAYLADSYWGQFADIYQEDCDGIDGTTRCEIIVYPNPATDRLTLQVSEGCRSVELVNALGKTVLSKEIATGNTDIDVSSLERGIYFLRLQTIDGMLIRKVILQ
ncbi:MAG: leucine-rich repeat protein [Bacteroidales bacterium]|nr:leucine-rich repeat protein [Bacteroidales bacterium]